MWNTGPFYAGDMDMRSFTNKGEEVRVKKNMANLLEEIALHVSSTTQPCRLQQNAETIDKAKTPTTYSLYNRKGERTITSDLQESEEETNKFFLDVYKYVHRRALDNAKPTPHQLFPSAIFADAIGVDCITEKVQQITKTKQLSQVYEMDDLSFNLTPDQRCFFNPGEAEYFVKRCENEVGCYYRYFYPQVKCAGPIAMPASVGNLICYVLPNVTGDLRKHFLHVIESLVLKMKTKLCIVCLLIHQAVNQFDLTTGTSKDVILLNVQKNDVTVIPPANYLEPVININNIGKFQFHNLNFLYNYKIVMENDVWVVVKNIKKD